jgi:hypothetical protein
MFLNAETMSSFPRGISSEARKRDERYREHELPGSPDADGNWTCRTGLSENQLRKRRSFWFCQWMERRADGAADSSIDKVRQASLEHTSTIEAKPSRASRALMLAEHLLPITRSLLGSICLFSPSRELFPHERCTSRNLEVRCPVFRTNPLRGEPIRTVVPIIECESDC